METAGHNDLLDMNAQELLDWLYFVLAENRTEKDLKALDISLEPQVVDTIQSQEQRIAAIKSMGGGIQ